MDRAKLEKIIYRCGWCGNPVDKNGEQLPEINSNHEANKYLETHKNCNEELVNGFCCPDGNEPMNRRVQVTRDMAIDAGMPETEGQWIPW